VRAEDVTFDVPPLPGDAAAAISGTLYRPEKTLAGSPASSILFVVPGASYTRSYWNAEVEGLAGYSFAEFMTDRGFVVMAVDNLGTGASSRPVDGISVTVEAMADANHAFVVQLEGALQRGDLFSNREPLGEWGLIGIGHSMGASVTTIHQSKYRDFSRVVNLGYSAFSTEEKLKLEGIEGSGAPDSAPGALPTGTYIELDRTLFPFYAKDVPDVVRAADARDATVVPLGALATMMQEPVTTGPHMAQIDTPVFVAYGQQDVSPDPLGDAVRYSKSPDLTLFRLHESAHCHNFASTRNLLWERLANWLT
jgi:pimeloyl-ACP methyl ester carboxylesterase